MYPPPQAREAREGALWTGRGERAKRDAAQGYRSKPESPQALLVAPITAKVGSFRLHAAIRRHNRVGRVPARLARAGATARLRLAPLEVFA